MNENTFSKKLISLRKKYNFTQQDLADKLGISNKTISRWETSESYPDIDLLPKISDIFHVSIDYLLKEHDDFKELDKFDIISYIPWIISLVGVLTYYIFTKLSIPSLFSFIIYYFIIKFSYIFLKKYTDRKNGKTLVNLNTIANFFVSQALISQILLIIVFMSLTNNMAVVGNLNIDLASTPQLIGPFVFSYIIAGIYAFIHYKSHKTDEYCL